MLKVRFRVRVRVRVRGSGWMRFQVRNRLVWKIVEQLLICYKTMCRTIDICDSLSRRAYSHDVFTWQVSVLFILVVVFHFSHIL